MHSCHYKSESRFHRCHWTIDMPSKNNNNNNKTPENSVDISLHSEKANWKSTSKCYVIVWFQLKTSPSRRHNTCSPDDAHWLMYIKLLNLFFFFNIFFTSPVRMYDVVLCWNQADSIQISMSDCVPVIISSQIVTHLR